MQRDTSKEQDPENWWRGADKVFFTGEHQNQLGYRTSLPQEGFLSSLKHPLFYGPVSEGLMKVGQDFRSSLQPPRQNNNQTGQAESQVNPRHGEQLVNEREKW